MTRIHDHEPDWSAFGVPLGMQADIRRLAPTADLQLINLTRQVAVRLREVDRHEPLAVGDLVVHRDETSVSPLSTAEVEGFDDCGDPLIFDPETGHPEPVTCSWDLVIVG